MGIEVFHDVKLMFLPAEEAVRTYGGNETCNICYFPLADILIENIPSPIPGVRNITLLQPVGNYISFLVFLSESQYRIL